MSNTSSLPISASVDEAVRLSGLSKTDLYALLAAGTIDARKRGRKTLIMVDSLQRYIESLPRAKFGTGR